MKCWILYSTWGQEPMTDLEAKGRLALYVKEDEGKRDVLSKASPNANSPTPEIILPPNLLVPEDSDMSLLSALSDPDDGDILLSPALMFPNGKFGKDSTITRPE